MTSCLCGFDAAVKISSGGASNRQKSARVELLEHGILRITFSVGVQREKWFHVKNISQSPHLLNEFDGTYCLSFKDGTTIFMSCNPGEQKQFHDLLTSLRFASPPRRISTRSAKRTLCQPDHQELNSDQAGFGIDQDLSILPAEEIVKIPVNWCIPNFEGAVANTDTFVTKCIPQVLLPGIELKLTILELGRAQIHVKLAPVFSEKKSSATALMEGYELAFSSASGEATAIESLPLGPLDVAHTRGCSYPRDKVARLCSLDGTIILRGEIRLKSPSVSRLALRRMYESGAYSDFDIKASNRTFNVHKCVLTEVSQELKQLLVSNELEIKDTTPDAVRATLQFIYGDPLSFQGRRELACAVLELAEKFKLPDLKRVCEEALMELIGRSNVFALSSLAVRNEADFLCNRAFEYICHDTSVFFERSDEWASIKLEHPDVAMAICEFVISESQGETTASPKNLGPSAKKAKSTDLVSATPSNPTALPLCIPVRFVLPADFIHLMETSPPGFALSPLKVCHDSLPGISWELTVYPNGKDKAEGCIAVFMRAVCASSKKSRATAPTGGFSLAFQSGDGTDVLKFPFHLSVQRFCKDDDEHQVFLFAPPRRWLTQNCNDGRPAAIVGEILVEAPAVRQIVHLRKLLESGDESDFVLKADGEAFRVHKNILSQSSPVMAAMLRAGFREARNKEMEIGETTAEAVRAMLQFWYGDPLCFDGLRHLSMEVRKLAARYQDDELRDICENALIKMISLKNVVHIAAFAVDQNCERLEKAAFDYIKEDARVILKEESWAQFKEANLKLALAVAEKLVHLRPLE